ncbi:MAG: YeeE/YedE family protein [Firmicutes bacterium]|nr:YeeE/YedE family protein [Bacillota bacterium]
MGVLLLGLITGVAFGYILQNVGVARCGCIFNALTLKDLKAVKMMLTAVAVGSLIVYPASALGWVTVGSKTLYVLALIAGGGLFGAGFALAGYCPGTALAALGAGRREVLAVVGGGLAGALAYAVVYPVLEPLLIRPLNFGRVSWPDLLGTNPVASGLVFAGLLLIVVWLLDARDRSAAGSKAPAAGTATPERS